MPYEDLEHDEAIAFHEAVINKHQQLKAERYAAMYSITIEERQARAELTSEQMKREVRADDFKKPAQAEPVPTVEETETILNQGEQ